MRLTFHNGKTHKNGKVYSTKHNDRNFDVNNAKHIKNDKTQQNINVNFGDIYKIKGFENLSNEAVELLLYEQLFKKALDKQNAKYLKNRQKSRIKTINQLYKGKNTSPEETIFQIGNLENSITPELLHTIFCEYLDWHRQTFPNCFILNYNLHQDEQGAPHIHFRKVWVAKNGNGDYVPSMTKCLAQMGIKPSGIKKDQNNEKITKYFNSQITYTKMNREFIFELCKKYNLNLEKEPKEKSLVGKTLTQFQIENDLAFLDNLRLKKKKEIKDLEEKVKKIKNIGIEYQNLANQILKEKSQFENLESLEKYIDEKANQIVNQKMESTIKLKNLLIKFIKENNLVQQFNSWQNERKNNATRITPY